MLGIEIPMAPQLQAPLTTPESVAMICDYMNLCIVMFRKG